VRRIKFRGLLQSGVFIYGSYATDGKDYHAILRENPDDSLEMLNTPVIPESVGQLTGIQDKNDVDFYVGDIGEFPNGDRFIVAMEDWLEVYIQWIGEPECEDQARNLYRISKSTIIGNEHINHINPELLEQVK
jgi:hypothetical protein